MKVTRLSATHYRNLKELEIYPQEGVNIIYGENAQGKTNLLESIWMFTGCRSFRGAKDAELISLQNEAARLEMDFMRKAEIRRLRFFWMKNGMLF